MSLVRTNDIEANRQKQMMRLMQRYATLINTPGTFILPYSWNIAYIDLDDKKQELQYEEFYCNTNNIVFAAMIYEGQMLLRGVKITIAYIEFNNLVKL